MRELLSLRRTGRSGDVYCVCVERRWGSICINLPPVIWVHFESSTRNSKTLVSQHDILLGMLAVAPFVLRIMRRSVDMWSTA